MFQGLFFTFILLQKDALRSKLGTNSKGNNSNPSNNDDKNFDNYNNERSYDCSCILLT